MKVFTSKSQKIGKIGEDVAAKFLMKHDFEVIEKNYTKKWGEIDLIAKKGETIHFIEVKSASKSLSEDAVTREPQNFFKPEENMHPWKKKRLSRTIETYLIHHRIGNTPWQFDVLLVYLDLETKKARVAPIENVIL